MSYVVEELNKMFPSGISGVRIAINSAAAPARKLAVTLFDLGAIVIVGDREPENITALNRELHHRSGSLYRYKVVFHATMHLEAADVIIEITDLPEGYVHAKNRIRPKAKAN